MRKNNWIQRSGLILVLACLILAPCAFAQQQEPQVDLPEIVKKNSLSGKLQIGIHYGPWTLKPFSNYFEDDLLQEISREIRERVNNAIFKGIDWGPLVTDYDDELVFGTSGYNFGVEIRFYPKGPEGSFSLGFSVERTNIKIKAEGPINQYYIKGASSTVEGLGYITTSPLTMNLSFRWDTSPSWRVSPYFVTGFGLATLLGEVGYEWTGSYQYKNIIEQTDGSDILTLEEVEWQIDENIPNIFYLFQLSVGVRARITPNFYINGEIGFWNGMVFRAGVFYGF
ncbi:MAG: hypothetical protein GQ545_07470 [Candidatus Aminicenantes bacterium]|nr:hypothetical protein [Candidatus Aminicenantes bacterium]